MIGILIFPDFQLLDAAGPISAFEIAARYAGAAPAIRTLAVTPGPVRSDVGRGDAGAGLKTFQCDHDLDRGGRRGRRRGGDMREDARLRARHGQTRRPHRQRLFRRLYPCRGRPARWPPRHHALAAHTAVRRRLSQGEARSRPIYTRDGNIWTSAGITAGIDLSLAMVAEDYGDEIAQRTAKQLVLYHRRSGGQSQFSSLLELKAPTGRFAPLLAWAREHLDAPLTVEDLAEQAGMSSRHFTRAFIAETGTTPSKAVERLRIEVARQRVQSSSEAIERVAETTGFRDPERMRRAFIRAFGQPPQSLRRAARAG